MLLITRVIVFILLLTLLYALWRYQQYLLGSDTEDGVVLKKIDNNEENNNKLETATYKKYKKGEQDLDDVTISNVSQYSIDKLDILDDGNSIESYISEGVEI